MLIGGGAFELIFSLVFILLIAAFIITFVKGIAGWHQNNQAPRLSVAAQVVSKRTSVTHHHSAGSQDAAMSHSSTTYYVTFQVDSGDRMELRVTGSEFGMTAEGDRGTLTFQGTRFLAFERQL